MDDDFNPDELRPVPYRPDTELMLGPWALGGIFFCLILLCGICFSLGYTFGRRGAHASSSTGQQGAQASPQAAGSVPKPAPQAFSLARRAVDSQSPQGETGSAPAPVSPAPGSTSLAGANAAPLVKAALPGSATAPGLALMVQIAAVSHQEDADVLVGALRKRGFAVTTSRDPADNLIHVRIGPFASLNDANASRQKLLNDGYNAVVQP